jgi:SAM-dependent methyltransferase
LLDVGCGDSPYRTIVESHQLDYVGVDIEEAGRFGYQRPGVVPYDGEHLPFPDASFDFVLCTEVLEHVAKPEILVGEMRRVLRSGGAGLVTVPWSARYHYIPWDFFRFTPSSLKTLFQDFSRAEIAARGTDLTAIASKVLVACLRAAPPQGGRPFERWFKDIAGALVLAPVALPALVLGHASLKAGLGSSDDPLGYSIFLTK